MAQSSITKNISLKASGILSIEHDGVWLENTDTGALINMADLLSEFSDKYISLFVNHDYDYVVGADQ